MAVELRVSGTPLLGLASVGGKLKSWHWEAKQRDTRSYRPERAPMRRYTWNRAKPPEIIAPAAAVGAREPNGGQAEYICSLVTDGPDLKTSVG